MNADVIVIGGGILGAATAFYLTERGIDVIVLEADVPNRQGSGTTAGNLHIQATHTQRPGTGFHFDNLRLLPLQKLASQLWEDVPAEIDRDIELRRNGGFMVAETEDQVQELRIKMLHEKSIGIPTELVEGQDLRSYAPYLSRSVLAATWCSWDGYANPLLTTPGWLAAASRGGARILSGSPVTSATRIGSTWKVSSGDRSWSAPSIVAVPGPALKDVASMFGTALDVTSVSLQMHLSAAVPAFMTHLVQHVGEGLSVKQVKSGQVMIGGGWPAITPTDARGRVSTASMRANIGLALAVLPDFASLRLLRTWAGPLAATPDELPVIGALPSAPNVIVGGGSYSFTLAPLWGRTLASLACGEIPDVSLEGLTPDRLDETPIDAFGARPY